MTDLELTGMEMENQYEYVGPRSASPRVNSTENWNNFAQHRATISALLVKSITSDSPSLCVWGAGRTTDLDFNLLLQHFASIDLVDIDGPLLHSAIAERKLDSIEKIRVFGDVDLTGVSKMLSTFQSAPHVEKAVEIKKVAAAHELSIPQGYDLVASTCVLSQLMFHLYECLGKTAQNENMFVDLIKVIRQRHIELMLQHTRPGGNAILITDVTSSDALPEIDATDCNLDAVFKEKICARNHFHGMNPLSIGQTFNEPSIKRHVKSLSVTPPWIWNATTKRYVCVAYRLTTKEEGDS